MSLSKRMTVVSAALLASQFAGSSYAQVSPSTPAPPPPFTNDSLAQSRGNSPVKAYAQSNGVSEAAAKERLEAQQLAVEWAQELARNAPAGFVTLEIRHAPAFKVRVIYNREIDQKGLMASAPVALRRYLIFNPSKRGNDQLANDRRAIADALRNADIPFNLTYSFETEKFEIGVPDGISPERVNAAVPQQLRGDVSITGGAAMVKDAAALYGGFWYHPDGSTSHCTAGWPVRNSSGLDALLTAGHCARTRMDFPYSSATLTTVSSWAHSNDGYQTKDYAFFVLQPHTTGDAVYIENGRTFSDGSSNNVPGIVSTYYQIDNPKQPVLNQYICKEGTSTALTCGYVADLHFTNSTHSNLVKVDRSVQPYIALGGDSGGPVFTWRADGSMVYPNGIMTATAEINGQTCKNTSSTAGNNTRCFFLFSPLTTIRAYSPFSVKSRFRNSR